MITDMEKKKQKEHKKCGAKAKMEKLKYPRAGSG